MQPDSIKNAAAKAPRLEIHPLSQEDSVAAAALRSAFVKSPDVGEADIVVNNAGHFPNRSIDELDLPTWRKTTATNLHSHFLSEKYFLPGMRKKK